MAAPAEVAHAARISGPSSISAETVQAYSFSRKLKRELGLKACLSSYR